MNYITRVATALEREESPAGDEPKPATQPAAPPSDAAMPEPVVLRPGELLSRLRRRLGKAPHPVVYHDPTVTR